MAGIGRTLTNERQETRHLITPFCRYQAPDFAPTVKAVRGFFICEPTMPPLREFIADRLPMLDEAMSGWSMGNAHRVLVAMTGLNVAASESIWLTAPLFHRKLIEMEAAGTLYLVGLDAAMKEVQRLRTI